MAKDFCGYHPDKAASWNCVSCGSLLCQDCFPAPPTAPRAPYCTLCGGDVHYLGTGHAQPPFWSQMPRFFAYPFALNGALFLGLLALLTVISARLFDPNSILILLPAFVIVALFIRQGLRVIEFCSRGKSEPPAILDLFDGNPTTLKMLGLMLGYGIMVGTLGHLGLLGIVAIVALSALLPASIMLLAIHGSLREALDPIGVFGLAARTGWSYLGLTLVLIVTAQGPQQAIGLIPEATLERLAQHNPEVLMALLVVSTAYFNMVMGAMMGYLLFQHHQELGIAADAGDAGAPADSRALEMARAVILVRESRYEDALKHMAGMVVDHPKDIGVLEYHHKLLCQSRGDPDRVLQHTERFLQVLLETRRKGRMVAVLEAARQRLPQYKPKSVAVRIALAEEYFSQRQFSHAIALIGMLHTEAPTSEDLPAAYYLLARIYSEGLRDDAKALMILDFVLKHCPGSPLAGEIENYRKVILSLAQTGQVAA